MEIRNAARLALFYNSGDYFSERLFLKVSKPIGWFSHHASVIDGRPIAECPKGVIREFRCRETARLFEDERVGRFAGIERVARRKLLMLHRARALSDLAGPPGNRLEALRGARLGQYCIRVNKKWRICLRWYEGDAFAVEIVDYH